MSFIFTCPQCRGQFNAEEAWIGMEAECPSCHHQVVIQKQPQQTAAAGENFCISCPNCNQQLEVRNEWRGMQIGCPNCQQQLLVPQAEAVSVPQAEAVPEPQTQPSNKKFVRLIQLFRDHKKRTVPKSFIIAKNAILLTLIGVLSIGIFIELFVVTSSKLEKSDETKRSIQKILNRLYGSVGPVELISVDIHHKKDKIFSGTISYSWNGKTYNKEIAVEVTKDSLFSVDYETKIELLFNYEDDRYFEDDALFLFYFTVADIKACKGIKVESYNILPNKQISYNVSLNGKSAVIVLQISKQADGKWFSSKIISYRE